MADMTTVLIGAFDIPGEAQRAEDGLRSAGFTNEQMLLLRQESETVRGGSGTTAAVSGGTPELAGLLTDWNLDPDLVHRIVANAGAARALVVIRPGARQQDAARIFKDYGARIFGNVSDADFAAFAATGYDTTVGTRATVPGGENLATDQLGAATGDAYSWQAAHPRYREEWQERTGGSDEQWQAVAPGYHYAHEMRRQPGYPGQTFAAAEPRLRTGYPEWASRQGYPYGRNQQENEGIWQKIKTAVEDAWDYVTPGHGSIPSSHGRPAQTRQTATQPQDQVIERRRWVRAVPQNQPETGAAEPIGDPNVDRPRVVEREMP